MIGRKCFFVLKKTAYSYQIFKTCGNSAHFLLYKNMKNKSFEDKINIEIYKNRV